MPRTRWLIAAATAAVLVVVAAAIVGWRRSPAPAELVEGAARSGATTTTATTAGGTADDPHPGAAGAGDSYYPDIGNGGFDVGHYQLDLRWDPGARRLSGTTTVTATASQDLSSFALDLVGMEVSRVTVDGVAVPSRREGQRDLRITPARPLATGHRFTVAVTYAGGPHAVTGSDPVHPGWYGEPDGDLYTVFEPDGAATLFPVNDHPSDKATYGFRITVPAGLTVVTNGRFVRKVAGSRVQTWVSEASDPMASYLVQVAVGNLDIVTGTGPHGLALRSAIDADASRGDLARAVLGHVGGMIDYYDGLFGRFPFGDYGGLVVDHPLGFALETQTLTIFGDDMLSGDVVAHELAHQWFGDDVSLGRWQDIWLNEGFATYAQWMWSDHVGEADIDEVARRTADNRFGGFDTPPADPGAGDLFSASVYERGALTLYVLRHAIGDDDFFTLLRTWVERYGGRSATTADFEKLASQVSGQDLTPLFDAWLRAPQMPELADWVK